MLAYYIEHQKDVVIRRTRFDLRKAEERAHVLLGFVDPRDYVIRTKPDRG